MSRTFFTCLILSFALIPLSFASQINAEENWPRFRGPNGQSVSAATGLPSEWSAEKNIAWKTPLTGEGWSSPIVWGDHVFLSYAKNEGKDCHVMAVNLENGEILWDKMVFTQDPQFKHDKNTNATSTPVTDGKRVYAVFGSGGFAALDFEGNIAWTNRDLKFYSQHGLGTSPILYDDLLIMAVDWSSREEPKGLGWQTPWDKSYVLALDKNTGKERWKAKRGQSRIAHVSPFVLNVEGKDQIISCAGDVIQGFDPKDGELIWTVRSEGEGVVPSPAVGDGLIFTASGFGATTIRTVKMGGKGECTATHIAWEQKRNAPSMASLLYVKPCLYTSMDNGSFTCYDAASGDYLWHLRLGGALNPSPLYADGKIYVLSERGETTVLKPAADPKQPAEIIAKNPLGEHALASPAIAGNRILIRTDGHLWCIGE